MKNQKATKIMEKTVLYASVVLAPDASLWRQREIKKMGLLNGRFKHHSRIRLWQKSSAFSEQKKSSRCQIQTLIVHNVGKDGIRKKKAGGNMENNSQCVVRIESANSNISTFQHFNILTFRHLNQFRHLYKNEPQRGHE